MEKKNFNALFLLWNFENLWIRVLAKYFFTEERSDGPRFKNIEHNKVTVTFYGFFDR
jgi:hypothetical protein